MKNILLEKGKELHEKLCEISDYIYKNPELGNQEYKAVEVLTRFLKEHNFEIEKGLLGIETAFRAIYDSKKEGPTIGYLCEYDALPSIGHGCGHNMIGSMSAGAGVILSKVIDEVGGRIIVYGTPAEETNGAKVILAEEGVFDELDVAMMVHPADITAKSGTSMALYPLQFTYKGKTAHAAACPQDGINALNSVIQLFNGIDALRQHVTPDVRMHGIITNGGVAANIVPDEATAQFYFRADKKETLDDLLIKVKK
ncbi:M20 family metallopeptidase [Romboutsia timonensis]|uniref:M20 family metallopeptidase n=1 Tax=Romboutsia timonensis TaxID=1776391 RepID=UPI002A75C7CD|nr:M20 family metallopeptidase [Romboutsia timonensis]MDY3001136.1 M20 family metallopeptidase [Romboutsia timonensis]MDY3958411.1 M20 family metallopeptidase [Romboutsia timonensis]